MTIEDMDNWRSKDNIMGSMEDVDGGAVAPTEEEVMILSSHEAEAAVTQQVLHLMPGNQAQV